MNAIRNYKREIHQLVDNNRQLQIEYDKLQQRTVSSEQIYVQIQQQPMSMITQLVSSDTSTIDELEQTKQMARLTADTYMV